MGVRLFYRFFRRVSCFVLFDRSVVLLFCLFFSSPPFVVCSSEFLLRLILKTLLFCCFLFQSKILTERGGVVRQVFES